MKEIRVKVTVYTPIGEITDYEYFEVPSSFTEIEAMDYIMELLEEEPIEYQLGGVK